MDEMNHVGNKIIRGMMSEYRSVDNERNCWRYLTRSIGRLDGLKGGDRHYYFQEKAGVQDLILLERVQVTARGSYWPRGEDGEDAHNVHAYIVLCGVHS